MPVPTSLYPSYTVNDMDSVIKTLTLSLRKYGRFVNAEMPFSKVKFLLSQLRHENLRALTAVAKTRALLAEMESLVVQKQLDAQSRLPDAENSSKPGLQKRSLKRKYTGRKTVPDSSSSSSLHKLDNKSKAISKKSNTCVTCLSNFANSLNPLQIKKQSSAETPKCRTEIKLKRNIEDSDQSVPTYSISMNQNSKIDITPAKSETVIISDDEDSPENKNDKSEAFVSTSPIAKKIFGIANYNIAQQKMVTHSEKDDSKKKPHRSSVDALPKRKINKKKPFKETVKTSLKMSLPLNNIANSNKLINLTKVATEDTKRENVKKQSTKSNPPLKVQSKNSSNENKSQTKSIISNDNLNRHTSPKLSLPLLSNSTNKRKTSKESPLVGLNKSERERLQSLDKPGVVKEKNIENMKKTQNIMEIEPVTVSQSTIKHSVKLQAQGVERNYLTGYNEKKQTQLGTAPPVRVNISLPLTTSNLANHNRASQNIRSKYVERTLKKTPKKDRLNKTGKKEDPSSMVSSSLNSSTNPNLLKNLATKENPGKSECRNYERKESQNIQDKTSLFAWRNINWGTWEARQMCNEEKSQTEAVKRSEYKTWGNGPMRKVSWQMFTKGLYINYPNGDEPCPVPPAKTASLEQRTDDAEKRSQATCRTANRMNKELMNSVTVEPSEIKRIDESTTQAVQPDRVDNFETTNLIFKQIMLKKETKDNLEDTKSISSDQTAFLCTVCQCLHETKECPNRKYFKFLGVDNLKTEM